MYRRRYYRSKGSKYSNETVNFGATFNSTLTEGASFPAEIQSSTVVDRGFTIVPPSDVMGSRKIKNIKIRIAIRGNSAPIYGVLVYAPQGTVPSGLTVGGNETNRTYEPNQNVISSFLIPTQIVRDSSAQLVANLDQQVFSINSRLARILNSGDTIKLILATAGSIPLSEQETMTVEGMANYVIKY